jgi:hypothetical protein
VVVPPTDRPAVEDPLLIQEFAAEKRAGVMRLVWVAMWVVGAIVLHLVLDSPFTGATLLVYALPLLAVTGYVINAFAKLSVERRHRRRLGTGARQCQREVAGDRDEGGVALVRGEQSAGRVRVA